jgi:hypothetical protein
MQVSVVLQRSKGITFIVFSSTILYFYMVYLLSIGLSQRFQANEKLLEENYHMVKLRAKTLWTTLIITKVIYVSIWIALPIIIGITWWKVLIGFFCNALYCRINIKCRIQLARS